MAKRKGTKAAQLTAKKANRKRIAKARIAGERQDRAVESPRMQAKAEAREATLDQIALDKLNGLEEGKVCRKAYKALNAKERPQSRPARGNRRFEGRRANHARPASSYRHARRNLARRRVRQHSRSADLLATYAPTVPVTYNLSREMARRMRQRQAPAALRLAA